MTDWKIIFALCYSEIPNREADTKTDIELYIQFETKDFTLFHIVASSIFSQISKLNFDYCCNFDMFYYSTFLIHRNGPMDLITYRWVLFKIYDLFEIIRKMVRGEEIFFFRFCNSNKLFSGMSKYRVEACPQMSYDSVFQSKQGPIISYHISNIQFFVVKTDF